MHFLNEKFRILIRFSLKFVPTGPIDNKRASVQVIAWRQIGDKPLPEQMLIQVTEAYIYMALGGDELKENVPNFAVRTAPANGQALSGARPSADTLVTRFRSCVSGIGHGHVLTLYVVNFS